MSEEFEESFDAIVEKICEMDLYFPRDEFKKILSAHRYAMSQYLNIAL